MADSSAYLSKSGLQVTLLLAMGAGVLLGERVSQADTKWHVAGNTRCVTLNEPGLKLTATTATTAGALSEPFTIGGAEDTVVIEAEVEGADTRAVTFSVHDATTGEALGYWQNPVAIAAVTRVGAVLPLSKPATRLRLFAGTHGKPSQADIRHIRWRPARRTMSHTHSVYGAVIDESTTIGQTFKAAGPELAAAVIRVRQLVASAGGPNLRVSVYPWKGHVAASTQAGPIAEAVIPRYRVPGEEQVHGEGDVFVTYGAAEIDLAVPLVGKTSADETYLLRLAVDGPCGPNQGYLTLGWVNGYPEGALFRNGNATDWDLCVQVYETRHGYQQAAD